MAQLYGNWIGCHSYEMDLAIFSLPPHQLDKEKFFTYDASGNQLSVRDPNSVGADMLYDSLGRNTQRTDTFGYAMKRQMLEIIGLNWELLT